MRADLVTWALAREHDLVSPLPPESRALTVLPELALRTQAVEHRLNSLPVIR